MKLASRPGTRNLRNPLITKDIGAGRAVTPWYSSTYNYCSWLAWYMLHSRKRAKGRKKKFGKSA